MNQLIPIGIFVIIIGFVILIMGLMTSHIKDTEVKDTEVRGGGVILIGPIPIIWGTDRSSLEIVLILAIILMLVSYFVFKGMHI